MTSHRIEHVPLPDLKPDPKNPKAHAVETIDASMSRFGVVEPIVVDERTGYVISGHGRLKTLRRMSERGETPPEGVTVADDGTWQVPAVRGWSSRSDADASAALIALNRTTELGGWVDDSLLELLEELDSDEAGFYGVGFGEDTLEVLRRKVEAINVFDEGVDASDMLDEFRDISGMDDTDYKQTYARKVAVYLRDDEAIQDFCDRLGIEDAGELGTRLHYPLGWEPDDRRIKANREAALEEELDFEGEE